MQRSLSLSVRVTREERALLATIAARLERSESDAVRQIIRDAGRALGLLPTASSPAPARHDAAPMPQP